MFIDQHYFRVESVVSHYADRPDPVVTLFIEPWTIQKQTPKGVWVERYGERHLCLHDARKKWAYPTKAEAWESFRIRTNWRIKHCRRALENALAVEAKLKSISERGSYE